MCTVSVYTVYCLKQHESYYLSKFNKFNFVWIGNFRLREPACAMLHLRIATRQHKIYKLKGKLAIDNEFRCGK